MSSVNISIWTAWLNGNSFHVHSHTLIGNAQGEHFSSRTLLTIPHLSPSLLPLSLPPSLLAISPSLTFPLLPTAVFYPLFCYYISFWFFSHLPASEFLCHSLYLCKKEKKDTFSTWLRSPGCFSQLCVCVHIDVLAIGDPNQFTILAVSIAGGIGLLIFLVTCFIVSGR